MFAKITKKGTLKILRGNRWVEQECPYKSGDDACYCGDWCPLLGEPEFKDTRITRSLTKFNLELIFYNSDSLNTCSDTIQAHFADDRVGEPFVLEPPVPDIEYDLFVEDEHAVYCNCGEHGLSVLDSLIPGLNDDERVFVTGDGEDITDRIEVMKELAAVQVAPADLDDYIDGVLELRDENPDDLI